MKYLIDFVTIILFITLLSGFSSNTPQEQPFGGSEDVQFAEKLWKSVKGYESWLVKSEFYKGQHPHGKVLRTYFSIVTIDGKNYPAIIKDNYGGNDATLSSVSKKPENFLDAVTIMVKREDGYDNDNQNWFWVKYKPDGSIDKNEKNMALAGRVAKGMDAGCISCHSGAKGNDYFFSND